MSSILKALKKLELEKAARNESTVEIARDILRSTPAPARGSQAPVLAGAVLVVLAALGGGYWAMKSESLPAPVSVASGPVAPSPVPAVAPAPVAAAPVVATPAREEAIPTQEVKPLPPVGTASPALAKPAQTERKKPAPATPPNPGLLAEGPSVAQAPAPKPQASVAAQASAPELVLSGIIYQDQPDARLAVVNELPVMAGTMIAGARVEEILRDRVRFSYQGRTIEVALK